MCGFIRFISADPFSQIDHKLFPVLSVKVIAILGGQLVIAIMAMVVSGEAVKVFPESFDFAALRCHGVNIPSRLGYYKQNLTLFLFSS